MTFRRYILPLIVTFTFLACGERRPLQPGEKILVRIGDRATISVNEFIRRAEYTVRPAYCRLESYIHKKIILNSLIAEKILALEAGDDNPLLRDKEFLGFLRGHREQAMRQWMFHQEATARVELDSVELKRAYKLAGREYEIAYLTLPDSAALSAAQQLLSSGTGFETLYSHFYGDTAAPRREVSWSGGETLNIHAALFSEPLEAGRILPPVRTAEGDFLLIKILGWSDTVVLTGPQRRQRWDDVSEKLTQIKANTLWKERVAEIMRGKRLNFNERTFYRLAEIFAGVYFKSEQEQHDELIETFWGEKADRDGRRALMDLDGRELMNEPFFTVGGRVWTVEDFRRLLISHPLVYRDRKMSYQDYPRQFRLAVADLMRDYYVTREAYEKGYDRVNVVERNEAMWRDTFLALHQKHLYLESIGEQRNFARHYMDIVEQSLNPYIDELQKKYYKEIELDFEAFEQIPLTRIDLFVKQDNVPFPYVVPLFPVITTDHLIEYLRKME